MNKPCAKMCILAKINRSIYAHSPRGLQAHPHNQKPFLILVHTCIKGEDNKQVDLLAYSKSNKLINGHSQA